MSIRFAGIPTCSGFLVNDVTVLTNEHCCNKTSCTEAEVAFMYRSSERTDTPVESYAVDDVVMDARLDVAALTLHQPVGNRVAPVALATSAGLGSDIYVAGHPAGHPLTVVLGRSVARFDSLEFTYTTTTKTKDAQLLYWADAAPGSSGSPVFDLQTHSVVAIHHSGGLEAEALGLAEQSAGFSRLLAGTEASAIAEFLESHSIGFQVLEAE